MAPQAPIMEATSSRPANITDTSIKDTNSGGNVMWLRENVQQLIDN